jgi:glucoamylase
VTDSLEHWLAREYRHAATAMLKSISASGIVKTRSGFGQTVQPVAGSIVASPVLAAYEPDPDYFFQLFRDSAIVIDAVRRL